MGKERKQEENGKKRENEKKRAAKREKQLQYTDPRSIVLCAFCGSGQKAINQPLCVISHTDNIVKRQA